MQDVPRNEALDGQRGREPWCLKRVKDALGHADIRSTELYAKLNGPALAPVFRLRGERQEIDVGGSRKNNQLGGVPSGIRTRVAGVKGRSPGPG